MEHQPGGPIAIIAGNGSFPVEIATSIVAAGHKVFIIGLRGFADRAVKTFPHIMADMLDPHRILTAMRAAKVESVILAGGVSRPGPLAILSIFSFFRNREELRRIMSGGDDKILRGVIRLLESEGFPVLGVDELAPDLLATRGAMGALSAPATATQDIATAVDFLQSIGRFDLGQGVVIAGGRILAVEGPEGTDAMLKRVRAMQRNKRVRLEESHALLIKLPKAGQDRRVDLPAIGPRTIVAAKAAGLSGIAVAAGGVVLVERATLLRAADRANLFIEGIDVS